MPKSSALGANTSADVQVLGLTPHALWLMVKGREYMLDYDMYEATLIGPDKEDELRSLITSRITRTFMMETVVLSSFVFWSPSDEDVYWRFAADYKYNDAVKLTLGGNVFDGKNRHTDFGTFALNDNLYLKVTYGF